MKYELKLGDCLDVLRAMPDCSVDSIVTDPPYGLSFMGKKWDYDVPSVEVWEECLRVLKPGGHLLAFAITRTQHRMAVRIEDAGFEIRDMIAWVYGSGFPKSLDVSKAIDKAAGAEREVVGQCKRTGKSAGTYGAMEGNNLLTAPATSAAHQWQGWGTALKPALEPITVARKPFPGTVAANVLAHGTGALNVDGCRVATEDGKPAWDYKNGPQGRTGAGTWNEKNCGYKPITDAYTAPITGRFPANLIHDGSDEVLAGFPVTKSAPFQRRGGTGNVWSGPITAQDGEQGYSDTGSAARFFYCAKASKADRDEGLEGFELKRGGSETFDSRTRDGVGAERQPTRANVHPTVKPTALMRYLCRLVTPPSGLVLDPFMGSGSTGKAAVLEGFEFIGIERDADYLEIATSRIQAAQDNKPLL
jgi:site-specific DNA-methyltransferase (adenine-specific)